MKKWICALCALVLTLVPLSALAAEGDAILAHGDDVYVNRVIAIGDTLYMDTYATLLTFRAGDAQPEEYAWNQEMADYGKENVYSGERTILEWDGELWCLDYLMDYSEGARLYKTLLSRVVLGDDGTAATADTRELEWPDELIDRYDRDEYPKTLQSVCVRDGKLYAVSYDEGVTVLDLDSGRSETLDAQNAYRFVPYTDGTFLLMGYDYSAGSIVLTVFDPDDGSMRPLVMARTGNAQGVAADPNSGAVYALKDGMICPVDLSTGELGDALTDMPLTSYNDANGWMLNEETYALHCDGGVVVRNLRPETREPHRLLIYDGIWADHLTDAYFEFTNTHSDVSVSISRDGRTFDEIIEGMMNRSGDTDIFIMQTDVYVYDALRDRGFLAEMDSEKLNALMENVYPGVKAKMTRDGKLVAMPVECYYWPMGVNSNALEKLGLSVDDVPTNWSDFLDFLTDTLPEYMDEESGISLATSGMRARDVRYWFFNLIFADYQNYAENEMDVPSYDTPLLRSLLEKLNQVDFAALGLPEEEEDVDGAMRVYSYNGDSEILALGYGASFGNFSREGHCPLVMSLDADTPAIMNLEVCVAVINPFSDEVALAQEFLECLADQLPETLMYNLDPTLNEPILRNDSGDYVKYAQENYDDVKKRYDEAEAADKQALEEELRSAEEWLADAEQYKWLVNQDEIDWFRANDDYVVCSPAAWLYRDSTGEAYGLVEQYMSGQIDASTLLKGIDKKIRMMIMEGN